MKKLFLMLAILMVSCAWASAQNFAFGEDDSYLPHSTATVDGVYDGKAYAKKMNGNWMPGIIGYSCTFSIEDGILRGNWTLPIIGHAFQFKSLQTITGPGEYAIKGYFVKNNNNNTKQKLTGTVNITKVTGTVLNFVCTAVLQDATKPSVFEFYSTNQ